ncbi:MarR family winged helix-turn-helix transcriptional regulator [Nocardia neocaledoniensis]|uniref:MarR family winged helix-turn-helix transcriptional regulator n=1 Tax=Nocardia neocaledoniensis TaxID=236511 RepID=UPI001ABF1092|nr:MarR family transcriptional regulator [Nocardia neocaledoniensis]
MDEVERIERAMIAIRRRQTRRALGTDQPSGQAFDVLDVVEDATAPTVSTVAAALAVDQPRASKLVAAAVTAGFLRREADQTDGRRSLLALTDRGREVLAHAHRRRRTAFDRAMTDWSGADRVTFARLLDRFVDALD